MIDRLRAQADRMGVCLTETMGHQFKQYQELLLDWNTRMNLTAITDPVAVQDKHFLDSLSCIHALADAEGKRLIDIGTGAGFPGIPLKIALPGVEVTLLDSLKKRVGFLNAIIDELGLTGIRAVHGRAEECARLPAYREQYDYAFARAVARLNVLNEYCLPYVKVGGLFVSQKGTDYEQELAEARRGLQVLGGQVERVIPVEIPDTDYTRVLILIRKLQPTPQKYPRQFSKIEKAPL